MLTNEKTSNVDQIADQLANSLSETLRETLRKVLPELARGTGSHEDAAAEAVRRATTPEPVKAPEAPKPVARVAPKPLNIRAKVELALRKESLDQMQLARKVDASAGRIAEVMKALKVESAVSNVGTEVHPIWTWKVGNDISTSELTEVVRRLLTERPYTARELSEVTGASYSRCGGAVVALQRDKNVNIIDLGAHGNACRWFILHPDVRDAHLEPKRPKKPKTN